MSLGIEAVLTSRDLTECPVTPVAVRAALRSARALSDAAAGRGAASAESARDRGHDAHGGAVVDGGAEPVEEAHVVVADEYVDEPAELA